MKTTKLIQVKNARTIPKTGAVVLMLTFVILWPTWSNSQNQTNVCLTGYAPASVAYAASSNASLDKIIEVLIIAENSKGFGDNGKAAGFLQIHRLALLDVNQRFKTNYVWPSDCLNAKTAREIAKKYLVICGYGKKSLEETIRRYNAGKRWECPAAKRYYEKVMKELHIPR